MFYHSLQMKLTRTRTFLAASVLILLALAAAIKADTPLTLADYQRDPAHLIEAYRHVEAA